jgi:hypothetical protein
VNADLLRLAAVITFVLTGVLLILGDGIELRTGLALDSFALAAFAASAWTRWGP